MKTQVQRWGNSLAVRIPKVFATQMGVGENTTVELDVMDGVLIMRASVEPTLDELLAGITAENLHGETDTGPAVGAEAW
jgi:antitoxin MazE